MTEETQTERIPWWKTLAHSRIGRIHFLWGVFSLIVLFLGLIIGYGLRKPVYVADSDDDTPPLAQCIRVLDGDTIEVEWMGQKERVRLLGIDAPETRRTRGLTAQAKQLQMDKNYLLQYGDVARKIVTNWILDRPVRLVFAGDNVQRDNFGRLLCYVEQQGADIGERLLLGGNAITYNADHPRMDTYQLFQAEAQKQRRGIWRNM